LKSTRGVKWMEFVLLPVSLTPTVLGGWKLKPWVCMLTL
jgi:hypothetical protein